MGIYVAYVMYYVDYPRKRSFYVHLKETVQSSFLRWFTACRRYLRRPTCECASAPGGRGSASDAQCSAGLTSLGALLKVLTSHHGGVC